MLTNGQGVFLLSTRLHHARVRHTPTTDVGGSSEIVDNPSYTRHGS